MATYVETQQKAAEDLARPTEPFSSALLTPSRSLMPIHPSVVRQDAREGNDTHFPNAVILLLDMIDNTKSAAAMQHKSRCFTPVPPPRPSFICSVSNV